MKIARIRLTAFALAFSAGNASLALHAAEVETQPRIGVYTGTFDPPHLGHADLIRKAIKDENLDILFVIPNAYTPHKPNASAYADRKQMAELAFGKIDHARLPDEALEKAFVEDGTQLAVLKAIRARYPKAWLTRISGGDNAKSVSSKDFEGGILNHVDIYDRPTDGVKPTFADARIEWHEPIGDNANLGSTLVRKGSRQFRAKVLDPLVNQYLEVHGMYSCGEAFSD